MGRALNGHLFGDGDDEKQHRATAACRARASHMAAHRTRASACCLSMPPAHREPKAVGHDQQAHRLTPHHVRAASRTHAPRSGRARVQRPRGEDATPRTKLCGRGEHVLALKQHARVPLVREARPRARARCARAPRITRGRARLTHKMRAQRRLRAARESPSRAKGFSDGPAPARLNVNSSLQYANMHDILAHARLFN